MKLILYKMVLLFKPYFYVDKRALGIFRIFLGMLCLIDISRRFSLIDVFYTNSGIISYTSSNSFYKTFSLLSSFTKSWEVHLFFILGIIFSIFLIIGYKTKLSQIMCAIIIISIHNRVIMLENAGDFVFNSILIISIFLPLGLKFSIDGLKKSLNDFNETSLKDLNIKDNLNNSNNEIFSLAFLAILLQIISIYIFTGLNKSGYDWMNGTAVYKMFELDTFLTSFGYYIRDFITLPISKFLTYSTLSIEFVIPFLIVFPFYSHILRLVSILILTVFHISIRMSIKVGMFSFTMISMFTLLLDSKIIDSLKAYAKKKIHSSKYILFYDSDCGFCHLTARIIKRCDLFNQIQFADKSYSGDLPNDYENLVDKTAILVRLENRKQWIRHEAFGKTLMIIPFGFLISWIFFIPGVGFLFGKCYDLVSSYRTQVSVFLGLSACNIKSENIASSSTPDTKSNFYNMYNILHGTFISIVVLILIVANMNYNLVANEAVNKKMEKYGFDKFQHNRTLKRISYYPRMIQRWNMFSPTVLGTDKTVIVEATLSNGDVIDLFTGEPPILNSLDYKYLWHDGNQFWRKFFSRVTKKQNKKYIKSFETWIKKYNNTYFSDILGDRKIKSVKIWSLSQRNSNLNSIKEYKLNKRLLNSNQSSNKKTNKSKK